MSQAREVPHKSRTLTFAFEISRACNLRCRFCYNSWKIPAKPETREASTGDALRILERVIGDAGPTEITLSGGEPLLRRDIFEVIRFIKKRGVKVGLVTNGTLITKAVADRCVSEGVDVFQVSLLSDRGKIHDNLTGSSCFEKAVEGILNIRNRNGTVYTFFVGTSKNISTFRGALELNVLLGVRNVAIGRFVPGGAAVHRWKDLMPRPEMLKAALDGADQLARRYPIAISISTPILPCLVDLSAYASITPGFCTVGNTKHGFFAIDPLGNLKACSHSPVLLGNLLEQSFGEIVKHKFLSDFVETLPAFCRDCPVADMCRGGCRSSAHLCYGSFEEEDPYLRTWKKRANKFSPSLLRLKARASGEASHEG